MHLFELPLRRVEPLPEVRKDHQAAAEERDEMSAKRYVQDGNGNWIDAAAQKIGIDKGTAPESWKPDGKPGKGKGKGGNVMYRPNRRGGGGQVFDMPPAPSQAEWNETMRALEQKRFAKTAGEIQLERSSTNAEVGWAAERQKAQWEREYRRKARVNDAKYRASILLRNLSGVSLLAGILISFAAQWVTLPAVAGLAAVGLFAGFAFLLILAWKVGR